MTTHDDALEPSLEPTAPTPQEWGFPANPTSRDIQCWHHQEAFLDAYRKCGKIGVSATAIGLTRWAVDRWLRTDQYAFKKRMEAAHQDYVELLETDMDEAISNDPKGRYGMPAAVQRIFRLKAEHPEKYREEVKVLNTEAPLRMLEMLKELGKKELEAGETPALESPAIEGEYREVSVSGQEQTGKAPAEPGGAFLPPEGTGEPPQRPPQPKARNVPETNKPSGPPPREANRR
jgi:hypothetical protein